MGYTAPAVKPPAMSDHFARRSPSVIRLAQIEFMKRRDGVEAINLAIGNVSLPMHPAMSRRMRALGKGSPHARGVVRYTPSVGTEEANRAFLNTIAAGGFPTRGLYSQVTDGGSQAMELAVLGTCGRVKGRHRPLMLIDPHYTNYIAMAQRTGVRMVSIRRELRDDGTFTLPDFGDIERALRRHRPGAIVVIPYDNPSGQFTPQRDLDRLARLATTHDCWIVSDEAYRQLVYTGERPSSVWGASAARGRRISIESTSKVWNACGLRVGALVTDNARFHEQSVAEYTSNLCANALGQHIFGAIAHEPASRLRGWFDRQRAYYRKLMGDFARALQRRIPGIVVSRPDAALYSVVDVRKVARPGFDAMEFVRYCARRGRARVGGRELTLLVAPMEGFFLSRRDLAKTMMRLAYVESPERMRLVPELFERLLRGFERGD